MSLAPESLGPTICIGEILAEIVAVSIGSGFTEPLELIGPYPSGAPAIFLDQCARMGGSAAMIGSVGNDDFGRLNLNRLSGDGVDVTGIAIDPEFPTGTAFVRYRADGGRDFVFNMWTSAAGNVAWSKAADTIIARAGHLHIMGTLLGNSIIWPMIERASHSVKARGGTISLDPNMRQELGRDDVTRAHLAQIVRLSDLVLPSGDELNILAGLGHSADEADAIEAIFSLGVPEIVLKHGADGSTCFARDGSRTHASAFIVEEVDPTGAGDCFGGAYVAARRLGMTIEHALDYANAASARNVTARGPMEGAGTRAELDQFMSRTARAS